MTNKSMSNIISFTTADNVCGWWLPLLFSVDWFDMAIDSKREFFRENE